MIFVLIRALLNSDLWLGKGLNLGPQSLMPENLLCKLLYYLPGSSKHILEDEGREQGSEKEGLEILRGAELL